MKIIKIILSNLIYSIIITSPYYKIIGFTFFVEIYTMFVEMPFIYNFEPISKISKYRKCQTPSKFFGSYVN